MKLGLPALSLLLVSLTACSSADDAAMRPTEVVAAEDWNASLALVPDGEDVYAARITRLDAIGAGGTQRTVAGFGYAACPDRDDERWGPTAIDRGYPSFVVDHGQAFLSHPFCGLWAVDLATGARTTLLSGPFGQHEWGGEPNVPWHAKSPIAFAPLGEDLAVCLTVDRLRADPENPSGEPDRIELWRVGLDGSAKEKLASLDPRDERCTHVLADGDALLLATDHAIYRWDPETKKVQTLTTDAGASFGYGLGGVAQDAEHVYFLRKSAIERVVKDGSTRTVLLGRPADLEPARLVLATDGTFVYWIEDRDLFRIPSAGGAAEKIVDGQEDHGVFPSSIAITARHVYYQRAHRVPSHTVIDEETGVELDDITVLFTIERVAK